ncbi:hypothetical protein GNP63_12190 [Aliivibrio fischeri]|uniref:hypothetical protein n=1 Tax=Aliivibrio fischeri TaxID=668 RepID=UPI0012D8DF69|nr:hypothetical protein [Aliivibrio fischeri]MUH97295.1 hypothetical protein [Aliivibrio fischeri]MUI64887.1 hypothetical protein [Aliivibrio fischeri]
MIQTAVGPLNGDLWERLIQSVYKNRYDNYQEMVTSPGDLGIEGFVLKEGIVIQCYCPDKYYDATKLHEKQVNKITADIKKLNLNHQALGKRLGATKIKTWIFITPEVAKGQLHEHARKKEEEVLGWGLSLIDSEFTILIKSLDDYLPDIQKIQTLSGNKLDLSGTNKHYNIEKPVLTTEYEKNISEKNEIRSVINNILDLETHQFLNGKTTEDFLHGYDILKNIYVSSPEIYGRLSKTINRFESDVQEQSMTWEGTPKELIDHIKQKLLVRLEKDSLISSSLEYDDLSEVIDHMVARWIAHCPLRIR